MAGVVSSSQIGEGERVIVLDREGAEQPVLLEEYLIGIVAEQIPAEYELETIKAQMIIARTYLYGVMGEEHSIPESALDLDILTESGMQELWGRIISSGITTSLQMRRKKQRGRSLPLTAALLIRCSTGSARERQERGMSCIHTWSLSTVRRM